VTKQVVDRGSQGVEEPFEAVEVGGVEGGDAGPEFEADPVQAVGVAGCEDHLGALGAGEPGRRQPDARAAPDHQNGLPEQVLLSPRGRGGGRGGHVVGAHIGLPGLCRGITLARSRRRRARETPWRGPWSVGFRRSRSRR
jgi:hypothetical protein